MKISITLTSEYNLLYGHDFSRILDLARWAEDAGIHQLDIAEHLLMGDGESYPFGKYPAPLDEPWPEPITSLAAIAAVTKRMRLGTGILIAPLRPPALLAKQLATLDRISNGRVDIGIASGWQIEEYQACGIPFENRNKRMDDTIRACQALWTGERVTLKLDTVELNNVLAVPTPVQKPLPIWYGGAPTAVTAKRIAEFGHGWVPLFLPEAELSKGIALIREAFCARGRNPDELQVRHSLFPSFNSSGKFDLEATCEPVERLQAMGVTMINLGLGWCVRETDAVPATLQVIGRFFNK
ncbi:MAG TPA: TIGR03619 family F420-dependent LLM class oxidoreductase [Spongiibacteraceae bacterium]|jgi:probable F420-dependent oxidoreductase